MDPDLFSPAALDVLDLVAREARLRALERESEVALLLDGGSDSFSPGAPERSAEIPGAALGSGRGSRAAEIGTNVRFCCRPRNARRAPPAATSLLAASVGCGDDSSGTAGAGSAGLSATTGAGPGTGTGASSANGPGAGSGGDTAGAGGESASTGGGASAGGGTSGGTGGAPGGTGGGEVAGCRPISDQPPGCDFEAPLLIDDSTPDEGGVVTIRDRCFLQPDTIALNADGTETEPAIRIRTERPVVLENVITVSAGSHVFAEGFADVTIRGASGYGLEPTVDDVPHGSYLTMYGFARATVERSYLSHTRGLQLWAFEGDDAGERSIRIVNNVVRNIDGRCRNTVPAARTPSCRSGRRLRMMGA